MPTLDTARRGAPEYPRAQAKQFVGEVLGRIRATVSDRRRLVLALMPGVVYLAIRLVGLLVLAAMADLHGQSMLSRLTAWDGQWYLSIADHGYAGVPQRMVDGYGHRDANTPLAFFPAYPWLIRAGTALPGVDLAEAAVLVNLVLGVFCAYGLMRLARSWVATTALVRFTTPIAPAATSRLSAWAARLLGSDYGGYAWRAGLLFVALFAAAPLSITLSMAYTEALFCALCAWSLVGVLERKWVLAGACCLGAGLVRPTAAALIGVVGLAAVIAVLRRQDGWRPWLGGALAPLGMLGYLGWVGWRTGQAGGYFQLQQQGWSSTFDGGLSTFEFCVRTLAGGASAFETLTVWIIGASLALVVLAVRTRMPWPLLTFALAVLAMDLGSDGLMYSKVRLLLPAFTLLLPVAFSLAKRRFGPALALATMITAFGTWFSAYSLTAWQYAI